MQELDSHEFLNRRGTMKVRHSDHIGIAVKTIEQAGKFYTDVLGFKIRDSENVANQKVNVAFIPITDSEVELLEPRPCRRVGGEIY